MLEFLVAKPCKVLKEMGFTPNLARVNIFLVISGSKIFGDVIHLITALDY